MIKVFFAFSFSIIIYCSCSEKYLQNSLSYKEDGMTNMEELETVLDSLHKMNLSTLVCYYHRETNLRSLWYVFWVEKEVIKVLKIDFDGIYFPKFHFEGTDFDFRESYYLYDELIRNCKVEEPNVINEVINEGDTIIVDDGYNPVDIIMISENSEPLKFTNPDCIKDYVKTIQSTIFRFNLIGYWLR